MKEISISLAEKLIFKETRKYIAESYLNKEDGVIVSPYSDAAEYARNLKFSAIEKVITSISQDYFIPEEVLEAYFEYIEWPLVIKDQIVSEAFIESFKEEINWFLVCKYQEMSESFIRGHIKYLDDRCWEVIWQTQILSNEFIITYQDKFPIFEKDSRMSKDFKHWWSSRVIVGRKKPKIRLISVSDTVSATHNNHVSVAGDQMQSHNASISNSAASYWDKVPNISDERRSEMKIRAEERAHSDAILAQQQNQQMIEFIQRNKDRRSINGKYSTNS